MTPVRSCGQLFDFACTLRVRLRWSSAFGIEPTNGQKSKNTFGSNTDYSNWRSLALSVGPGKDMMLHTSGKEMPSDYVKETLIFLLWKFVT